MNGDLPPPSTLTSQLPSLTENDEREFPLVPTEEAPWDQSIEKIEQVLAMIKDQKEKKGDPKWLAKMMGGLRGGIEMMEKCDTLKRRRTAPKMWSKDNVHTMYYKW